MARCRGDAFAHDFNDRNCMENNEMTKEKKIEQLRLAAEILEKGLEWLPCTKTIEEVEE